MCHKFKYYFWEFNILKTSGRKTEGQTASFFGHNMFYDFVSKIGEHLERDL